MGASLSANIYQDAITKTEVAKQFAADVRQSQYESGHSYSGEIGMLGEKIASWHDIDFDDSSKAWEWLGEHHQKWKAAKAVSFSKDGKKYWLIGGLCSS